jgi:FkbM family methyltransferase
LHELRSIELGDDLSFFTPAREDERFSEAERIYRDVFERQSYLQHGIELAEAPVVVDAGANIGLFAVLVNRIRPNATMLCFEPIPQIAAALRSNLERHGARRTTVFPFALGARTEHQVEFTYYPMLPGNSTRHPAEKAEDEAVIAGRGGPELARRLYAAEPARADVRRLSDVLAELPEITTIDLLKVDVESSEVAVLEGIDEADWPRIRQAVVEVHAYDERLSAVSAILESRGFAVTSVAATDVPAAFNHHVVYAHRRRAT